MNKLTAKIYPGADPKWTVIECVELPVCTQGKDKEDALRMLKEAVRLYLEAVAEDEPATYEHLGLDSTMMESLDFKVETEIKRKKSGDCQATHEDIMGELIVIKSRLSRLLEYGDEASEEVEEDRARYKNLTALLEVKEAHLPTLGELEIEDAYY